MTDLFIPLRNIRNFNSLFVLALVCFSILISSIAPPFTSPDEADHIKRAYFLSKGKIVLESINGGDSGGMLDSGMYDYINSYYSKLMDNRQHRFSQDEINYASSISWAGEERFSAAPGTNYYFPIIYAPQSAGLIVGKALGLSVDNSYRLSRLFATISAGIILLLAFRICSPPALALFFLAIPMSLFQLSSSSIDGITTAISILSISIFLKSCEISQKQTWKYLLYLSICVTMLLTSRIHMLPMIGLVFATYFYTKSIRSVISGTLSLLLVFTWLLIAMKTTVDSRVFVGASTSDVVLFYLKDPIAFFSVFFGTILDLPRASAYLESFIGILGWLDAPLTKSQYAFFYISSIIPAILTFRLALVNELVFARAMLLSCSVASIFFIFFALLVTYNTHPANVIGGVQGRYFIIPMIMASYAIGYGNIHSSLLKNLKYAYMAVFIVASSYITATLLIKKYYVSEYYVKAPKVISTEPSTPLSEESPIVFKIVNADSSARINRIGVMFATWARVNQGLAKIELYNGSDIVHHEDFDLSKINDNKYEYFNVDAPLISSAKIISANGGGVSIWSVKYDYGEILPCLVYEFSNGARKFTPGCPTP
ncbi:MAG TPA: DUF2142 domain-containing protein [Pseudomonas lactis]|uniref:DUF2142 domain-containing protein n=1 Tax=Pseudomonas lactis TaxID=1615674 RepID=A0A921T8D2_9PSED|nr:DUF2142 domain-containing protein [Pseudomonas lactis]HJH19050.1 DUF2142 domain-containing protein [Pseudomonas lactis]